MKSSKSRNRITGRKGFSIAEMLIAVLLVLMVSAVVAVGVPVAGRAYHKVVDAANAELLLSSTMTRLRSELSMSTIDESKLSATSITYTSNANHRSYTISCSDTSDVPTLQDNDMADGTEGKTKDLVNRRSAAEGLAVSFNGVTYDKGTLTISNLAVEKDGNTLASLATFTIRIITD